MKNIITLLFTIMFLSACGGSGGESGTGSSGNTNAQGEATNSVDSNAEVVTVSAAERRTQDILADPQASFKTFQQVNFIATNESDLNVTLFIYDNLQDLVARHYIKSQDLTEVDIQIPTSDDSITMHWHYREQVERVEINLSSLGSLSFTGFE